MSILAILVIFQSKGTDIGLFDLGKWRYVHIGDASENIKNALFLAKGGKLNEYVTSNHMPGLYLYLSLFISFLPNDFYTNSLSNSVVILTFSSFVTIFTLVSLCFLSINLLLKEAITNIITKIVFFLVLLNLFLSFDYFRVLSETYLPFIQLSYLSIFFYYLQDSKNRFRFLVSAIYLVGFSIFFGLTNFFADMIFLSLFAVFFLKEARKIRIIHILPAFLLIIFLSLKSGNFNYHYWIIETNKAQGLGSGIVMFENILGNILYWPEKWYSPNAFGPIYDHQFYILLLGILCIYLKRKSLRSILVLVICLFILPLDSWRIQEQGNVLGSQTYKTDVNMGVCFFFMLVVFQKFSIQIQRTLQIPFHKLNFEVNLYFYRFAMIVAFFILSFRVLSYITKFIEIERQVTINHSHWISQENICKQKFIRPNDGCYCLALMYWDQDFFLRNDVRPCVNQFAAYSPHLNSDERYLNLVKESFLNGKAAYLLNRSDLNNETSILNPKLIDLFKSGKCKQVHEDYLFLCKNEK
ncbi:hypothetical protein EHQ46_18460 [Leptospira yanagawae]|uniref:Glycosyltransferase RgtA/B/C/D-like domain-containing protein n=1 Tax=Leptospira yanagawae TaxID=293069 RepID=A0ABY2M0S4_9LEPT|nr:hypothetical protein [Leptospira yanagawae]TGL16497.1 hypothetical protein EHQ46_18460 [Leptospira yanagawae]